MAITKVKNYNIAPYYDDHDETKNYHRILFRPGFAVQARELTQLQTSLYSQVDKLGQYSFEDGSRVVGGRVTLNTQYAFVKLDSVSNISDFVGYNITGGTNGVTAKVLAAVTATGGDPDTLYIEYNTSGTANATKLFVRNESILGGTAGNKEGEIQDITTAVGNGSKVDISEGVYFISGTMVYVAGQTLLLDKYTNTPSYIIGLSVTESLVNNSTDSSLVDNAQGTPNYAAPGAHRYKITTALIKENLANPNATYENYILLMKITDGIIQIKTETKTGNTELTTRLARRTHEESGNYSVKPFSLDIREHLDDGAGNGGWLTSDVGGDATKLAIGVEPSTAYVQGYRVENLATKYVAVDKPRTYINENEKSVSLPIGNKVGITLSTVTGMPDVNAFATCNLRNSSDVNIGTARIRGFEEWTNTVWALYLFDITMTGANSFSAVENITQTNSGGQDFAGDLSATGIRYDAGNNGAVFQLPYEGVKSLLDSTPADPLEYHVRQRVIATVTATPTASFACVGGTVQSNSDVMIAVAGNAPVMVPPANITSNVGDGTLVIDNSPAITGFSNGASVQAIFTVKKVASSGKKDKLYNTLSATNFSFDGTNSVLLDKADIIKINTLTIGGVDAKDKFLLDNGQRDNFYDEGRLFPIGTQAAATLLISFDYYTHSSGDYFSVDSYPTNYTDGVTGAQTNGYEIIPTFNSQNGNVRLRDCLDFRPTKASAGSPTTGFEFTTGTGASIVDMPKPYSVATADISHYEARIDKLYIDREGNFAANAGISATNPKSPDDINDAMTIFELHYGPYVFSTKDLVPVKIDNKRYTMRDIGALDTRVKTLEYYTSLSLLEQQASDVQIMDGNNPRLKNGMLVDGFFGHNVGNVTHPEYSCSIDDGNGTLRPKAFFDSVNVIKHSLTNAVKTKSLITLPYTEVTYIEQPYATYDEFVNPYNVFTWGGDLQLSPESDDWKDTETRPDVVIDNEGVYDQLVFMAEENGILGTVWNEWETNWTGVEITETSSSNMITDENARRIFWDQRRRRRQNATTTITATTITSNQARSGLRTTVVPDTQLKELGSRVVATNFIPFMRSREVFFKAMRMKPLTKVYAYFNGSDVTNYCSETGGYKEWSDETDVVGYKDATIHAANTDLITDASGTVEGSFRIPNNSLLKFKTGTREFKLTDSSTNDSSEESTVAETLYHAQGLLEVKENVIMSTKVPQFVSTELTEERVIQETPIVTFNFPVAWIDPLAQSFVVDTVGGIFVTSVDIYVAAKDADIPLNVSIRSMENGIPTQQIVPGTGGIHGNIFPSSITTSADGSVATTCTFEYPVYLAQHQEYALVLMSDSDKYKVFVAETGGFDLANPTNRVTKQPYNGVFFTSQNSSTWSPEQTKDLKFKLKRASFSPTTGTAVLTNDAIPPKKLQTNPFHFVSTAGGSSIVRVKHPNHGMHGSNEKVLISGQSGAVNGITAENMNKQHDINAASMEIDSYAITVTGTATAVAIDSGGSTIYATENKHYDVLEPQVQTLEVPRTGVSWSLSASSGQSIDTASGLEQQAAYTMTLIGGILPNVNNEFISPMVVASTVNEAANTTESAAGNKSLVLTATLVGNETLTPVIDMNRSSAITANNRLNDATTAAAAYGTTAQGRSYVEETSALGSSNLNKYITKRIDLTNEADILDVYINVNRPRGSNIDLYYKVIEAGSDVDFDNEPWIAATPPEDAIPENDGGVYTETHYVIDPTIGKFGSFAFKVVLRSTNSSAVPTVKDFRAIAAT